MTTLQAGAAAGAPESASRPPAWLIACTGALAVVILVLAVAETNLKAHYLIDQGEFISVFGLGFIVIAGGYLAWRRRLASSLPLVFPWLLYPVITQGDQIIDNLSIVPMQIVCHVLLAAIFATPVAVMVLAARGAVAPKAGRPSRRRAWMLAIPGLAMMAEGRRREGAAILASALMVLEMYLADQYLGTLMIVTLIIMIVGALLYGSVPIEAQADAVTRRARSERFAAVVLIVGVLVSAGTYFGYKNRPGAYQGSPSFLMDPSKKASEYSMTRIAVPAGAIRVPAVPDAVRAALDADARTIERLLAGYHVLDRNYTYDFHNELFVRHTPLVPNYRATGLQMVAEARQLRTDADARTADARRLLADDDPLAALLDEMHAYLAFQFDRAPVLEQMSGSFAQTKAGLQHAAHLYEGEAKYLGGSMNEILVKHQRVLQARELAPVTGHFVESSRAVYAAYADHVVGF